MGKEKLCPKCGKEVHWSKQDQLGRAVSEQLVKAVSGMLPGIQDIMKESKDYCVPCWKAAVQAALAPMAVQLGKAAETWPTGEPSKLTEGSSPGENSDGAKS
jgi:hypothetical protein